MPTRTSEVGETGALAAHGAAELTSRIQELHQAVARRAGAPALHDVIARASYGGVRAGLQAAGLAARAAGPLVAEATPLTSGRRTQGPIAVLNGLIGDKLEAWEHPLTTGLSIRVAGRDVPATPEALAEAFGDAAGPRVAVFLHGLFEDERAWRVGTPQGRGSYGERLQADAGLTPVELRMNTGRRISHNGRDVAALLEELVAGWPVEVQELVLVGHSMGGLVFRSACAQAAGDASWPGRVSTLVFLGTPHLGSPVAAGVHRAAALLDRLPETRPVAKVLRARSSGIRDLQHGALVEDDWRDVDPEAVLAEDPCTDVPLLPGVRHVVVSAALPGPLGRVAGDLLVLEASASGRGTGRGRRVDFEPDALLHVPGATHFALLNHPAVHDHLLALLREPVKVRPPEELPPA